jgi:[ribosomal protein S18]-alanine N-acetyltransferase
LKEVTQVARVEFAIRDYHPADFETLWQIDQRCFPSGISYTRIDLSSFISKRTAVTLVAEFQRNGNPQVEDRIAGFVVAHALRRKYARVVTLDIVPEAQRYGLGTGLMNACEERLRAMGCTEVYLEAAVDNMPALRLYGKLGYEVLGVLPEYYASHSLDAFQMGKRL